MRSEISLLKHENSVLKAKEGSSSPAVGAGATKAKVKEEGAGTAKLRQRIAQLEMQLKQKVRPSIWHAITTARLAARQVAAADPCSHHHHHIAIIIVDEHLCNVASASG